LPRGTRQPYRILHLQETTYDGSEQGNSMDRRNLLRRLAAVVSAGMVMNAKALADLMVPSGTTEPMPVLFVGHGNPMNAITDNSFAREWHRLGTELPRPRAVLCVSAHWETRGTFVTAMEHPRTIHDFGGFPKALYEVQYPAPGSPAVAKETSNAVSSASVGLDQDWGLDHGCWSVLSRMFPKADIPVLQLSLDHTKSGPWHYDFGRELAALRRRGVLIIGSGNIVHNLRLVDWEHPAHGFDWALHADALVKKHIVEGTHAPLARYETLGREVQLAVPTPEHYFPMLYALALQEKDEPISFFNEQAEMGSLTMTSFRIG
jgi:4,5-DOPA dioxygenase extradiol